MPPALYAGFSGVTWVAEHLLRHGVLSEPIPLLDEIDHVLCDSARTNSEHRIWTGEFDLISGLVGLGVYGLERFPRPAARELLGIILERLAERAEHRADGITWWSDPVEYPDFVKERVMHGCYNLGVAHGTPGVIAFLGRLVAQDIGVSLARELLDGAVSWLMGRRLFDEPGVGFPCWIAPDEAPPATRTGWCYGNAGIAPALLRAAGDIGDATLRREAIRLAVESAQRSVKENNVVDACLCHGAAGNGHLFNRMYQATGEPELCQASRDWFERALELRKPGVGIAGFQNWGLISMRTGELGWLATPGFLDGAAGIGLALLAAVTPVEPAWDRLLLTSVPPQAG